MIGWGGGTPGATKRRPVATPTLAVAPTTLDVTFAADHYVVTCTALSANLVVTLSGLNASNFQLSADGISYGAGGASLTITTPSGDVSVYVRRTGPAGAKAATATNASTGATSRTVALSTSS